MNRENILISACLLGENCRYDGGSVPVENLGPLMKKFNLIPVCPEIIGGMSTPRKPSERIGKKVINREGEDVTSYYERGAAEVLRLAKLYNCRYAILKERSPSCGYGTIYDGTFSHKIIEGNGVTAEILTKKGIKIYGESQIPKLVFDHCEA